MKKVIENIRSKPHAHRDKIVKICVVVALVFMFIVWILVGNDKQEGLEQTDQGFFDLVRIEYDKARETINQQK